MPTRIFRFAAHPGRPGPDVGAGSAARLGKEGARDTMKVPSWALPAVIVLLVLGTVWAAYAVGLDLSAARSSSGASPASTSGYLGSGAYAYTAALGPNELFNATNVTGGNFTLFTAITSWINVSVFTSVNVGSGTSTHLTDDFSATLVTPAWSKVLVEQYHSESSVTGGSAGFRDAFDINVSSMESLVTTLDHQLNYTATEFTVTLVASVSGSIGFDGVASPISLVPFLNLTFAGPLIIPVGASARQTGTLTVPGDPVAPVPWDLAVAGLIVAVGALVTAVLTYRRARRSLGPPALPSLEVLIEPQREMIAHTLARPPTSLNIPVERWEDLVTVADTLGRPILRPVHRPGDSNGVEFLVSDGSATYLYRYPTPRTSSVTGPTEKATSAPARAKAGAPPRPETAVGPSTGRPSPGRYVPNPRTVGLELASAALRRELDRVQHAALRPEDRLWALRRIQEAARQVASGGSVDLLAVLGQLHSEIDRLVKDASRKA